MAENEGFNVDPLAGGSFSQLMFSDDALSLDMDGCLSAKNSPKMLCFGDYQNESKKSAQKSGVTCSDSSSASSTNNSNLNSQFNSKKKRNGCENEPVRSLTGAPAESQSNCKKIKSEKSTVAGHAKVKKEKLGERIAALQQLVSPFGKTDTASVLHEAMGYIRFLHDQVQVLCSPYLQRLPSSTHPQESGEKGAGESRKELRSRGLCLVPIDCTLLVENSNGADFWSPAMRTNVSSDY